MIIQLFKSSKYVYGWRYLGKWKLWLYWLPICIYVTMLGTVNMIS